MSETNVRVHPLVSRLRNEAENHQTVYADDRRRKALFTEAAEEIQRLRGALAEIAGMPSCLWNDGTTAEFAKAAEKALGDYD